eukprot:jgi/Mesvir1/627/Mv22175-RA.1
MVSKIRCCAATKDGKMSCKTVSSKSKCRTHIRRMKDAASAPSRGVFPRVYTRPPVYIVERRYIERPTPPAPSTAATAGSVAPPAASEPSAPEPSDADGHGAGQKRKRLRRVRKKKTVKVRQKKK